MRHDDYERLIKANGSCERLIKAFDSLESEIDDLIEAVNALTVVMARVREDKRKGDQDDKQGI